MYLNALKKKTSVLELILDNLNDKQARFSLIITKGSNAVCILKNYLSDFVKNRILITGSDFEGDRDKKDYNVRILSNIIQCMENGNKLIMQNLEQIYGSLYELFNQNFMIVGNKKNCRIALEHMNNPMCYVNDDFHCMILLDYKKIELSDPPFLNRFEK